MDENPKLIAAIRAEVHEENAIVTFDGRVWTADCEESRGLSYRGTWDAYGEKFLIVVTDEG